ncbi:unnamed protein product [Brugia pahangi]|uniref:Phage protein n=1 Tax=Brugia pahangi TaxID=6280 RepID=A0A0N4TEW4_BRUPA|nr:unnamed protein product [Brugia pahangi]
MDSAKMRKLMRKVKRFSANAECYKENGTSNDTVEPEYI